MLKGSVAVLDVGSSKITALTGERGVNGTFVINGMAEVPYDGFSEGEFFNASAFKNAVNSAVKSLNYSLLKSANKIFVGVPAAFIRLENKKYRLSLGKKRRIKRRDIEDLFNAGKDKVVASGYEIVYSSDVYFTLDDNRRVIDPIGNVSSVLGGFVCYQLCETYFTSLVRSALAEFKLGFVEFIYEGYTEGRYLASRASSDAPSLVVDVGHISTSSTIFSGNGVLAKDSFDFGGGFITAAFVEKYSLSPEAAEKLKRMVGLGYVRGGQSQYTLDHDGQVYNFSVDDVNETVKDVLDLLAENLDGFIEENATKLPPRTEVYLCGGGISDMRGATEHLAGRLGQPVELLKPGVPQYNKAIYASAISLLDHALTEKSKEKKFFIF